MKDLIYLKDLNELNHLLKIKTKFSDKLIVSYNPAVQIKLEKNNISFLSYNQFLTQEQLDLNIEQAVSIYNHFSKLDKRFSCLDVNVFGVVRLNIVSKWFLSHLFNAKAVLENISSKFKIKKFSFIEDEEDEDYLNPNYVIKRYWMYYFKNQGVIIKPIKKKSSKKNFSNDSQFLEFSHLNGLKNNFEKNSFLFIYDREFENSYKIIKALFNDERIKTCLITRTHLKERKKKSIFKNALSFYDFEMMSFQEKRDKKSFKKFYENIFLKELRTVFKKIDYFSVDIELFFKKYIYEQSLFIIKELYTFKKIVENLNPSQIYFCNSFDKSHRAMMLFCKRNNIITHTPLHGNMLSKIQLLGRIIDVDNYYVNNMDSFNELKKVGQKNESLKFLNYGIENIGKKQFKNLYSKKYKIKKIGFFSSDGVVSRSINISSTVNGIIEIARANQNFDFIIKMHPHYDIYDFWDLMKDKFPPNLILYDKGHDLNLIFKEIDIGVLINNSSGVCLDALLNNIPVIILKDNTLQSNWLKTPIDQNLLFTVNTCQKLKKIIKSFNDTDDHINDIISKSKKFIDNRVPQNDNYEATVNQIVAYNKKEINNRNFSNDFQLRTINNVDFIFTHLKLRNALSHLRKNKKRVFSNYELIWLKKLIFRKLRYYHPNNKLLFFYCMVLAIISFRFIGFKITFLIIKKFFQGRSF